MTIPEFKSLLAKKMRLKFIFSYSISWSNNAVISIYHVPHYITRIRNCQASGNGNENGNGKDDNDEANLFV